MICSAQFTIFDKSFFKIQTYLYFNCSYIVSNELGDTSSNGKRKLKKIIFSCPKINYFFLPYFFCLRKYMKTYRYNIQILY